MIKLGVKRQILYNPKKKKKKYEYYNLNGDTYNNLSNYLRFQNVLTSENTIF